MRRCHAASPCFDSCTISSILIDCEVRMTTGDEPMLPNSSDNSPMISSVLTRVIADARGAYLAGNLKALWDHMNPGQQLRFRQELTRQALYFVDQLITAY